MTTLENLKLVLKATAHIIEMDDTITYAEQFNCIDALRKLRTKLEDLLSWEEKHNDARRTSHRS